MPFSTITRVALPTPPISHPSPSPSPPPCSPHTHTPRPRCSSLLQEDNNEVFRATDLRYELAPPRPRPPLDDLKFGTAFTDHMFLAEHAEGAGWGSPAIRPFGPLSLHPAAQVRTALGSMRCSEGPGCAAVGAFQRNRTSSCAECHTPALPCLALRVALIWCHHVPSCDVWEPCGLG